MELPKCLCFLVYVSTYSKLINGQYVIPPVEIEAYQPSGIRVIMKAEPHTELFAFHGKVNEELRLTEPGEISTEITKPEDGYFVYYNPTLRINVGDTIYYWIFVQHNKFGYRRDNQKFQITELKTQPTQISSCQQSETIVSNHVNVCSGSVLFEDDFTGNTLNNNKWIWEQYIPDGPDYEFVVYQKDETVVKVQNGHLLIKPKLQTEDKLLEKVLDISNGCTKSESKRAKCQNRIYLLQNPIISGRLASELTLSYADIEIKAKLPSGEWMYPEIYLEDVDNYNKLVIAYSRGNKVFKGNDGSDIGGLLLFGGPIVEPVEPKRSASLSSFRLGVGALSDEFHVYRLKWTSKQIELFVDGTLYGLIDEEKLNQTGFNRKPPSKTRLVIGVGVGGINDFPDGFLSGTNPKPWKNRNSIQVKTFYEARDKWLPSWSKGGMEIEYVTVKAV